MTRNEVLDHLGRWYVTYDSPPTPGEQQALMIIVELINAGMDSASESETLLDPA